MFTYLSYWCCIEGGQVGGNPRGALSLINPYGPHSTLYIVRFVICQCVNAALTSLLAFMYHTNP